MQSRPADRTLSTASVLALLAGLTLAGCSALQSRQSTPSDEPTSAPPEAEPQTARGADEPVQIVGVAEITFILFEAYLTEPFVMLEDEAGFVHRDFEFVAALASQVLGPLTKTEQDSWQYQLSLPIEPSGTPVDVDNDGVLDSGVQVFAVAVQANVEGDPFLSDREFRGWSTEWSSARIDSENQDEIKGGKLVVWAPDAEQSFPSGFGEDGLLFTSDDPTAPIKAGYSVVDLDQTPFEFVKERRPDVTLYEGDVAVNDFSAMTYSEAFEALFQKASAEYPFTELKRIDWQALHDEFQPRIAEAEAQADYSLWYLAMRDFAWSIPDGHVGVVGDDLGLFLEETAGGLGFGIAGLDDGRIIAHIVIEGGPADQAGMKQGAEIVSFNGLPIEEALSQVVPWSSPFSTEDSKRLQQYRYLLRDRIGRSAEVAWLNSGAGGPETVTLTFVDERESFSATSILAGFNSFAPPVEYEVLEDSGYGYIRIWDLADDLNLTSRLFERAVRTFQDNNIPGVIIDLRQNSGGSPMGSSLARYFTDHEIELSHGYYFSEATGEFETYGPPDSIEPDPDLQFLGPVAVLVGPGCASACENVAWVFSQLNQVRVVGQYPSYGIYGEVGRGQYELPDGLSFQIPTGMELDLQGNLVIEGVGVVPDVRVPRTLDTVLADQDLILATAIEVLGQPLGAGVSPEGPPAIVSGAEAEAALEAQTALLEDLALESYEAELYEPGTLSYTITMARSRDALWATGWCASAAQFAQNWEAIGLTMRLDGAELPLERFAETEVPSGGNQCRFYYVLLTEWPAGEHLVTTEMTFNSVLDDGISEQTYAAGTRLYEYHVYVGE